MGDRQALLGWWWVLKATLSAKVLNPMAGHKANTNGFRFFAENIGAVAAGAHPAFHDSRGCGLAFGNIFASTGGIKELEAFLTGSDLAEGGAGRVDAAGHGVMVKITLGGHVGGVVAGRLGKVFVPTQSRQVAFLALGVDKGEDLLLEVLVAGRDIFLPSRKSRRTRRKLRHGGNRHGFGWSIGTINLGQCTRGRGRGKCVEENAPRETEHWMRISEDVEFALELSVAGTFANINNPDGQIFRHSTQPDAVGIASSGLAPRRPFGVCAGQLRHHGSHSSKGHFTGNWPRVWRTSLCVQGRIVIGVADKTARMRWRKVDWRTAWCFLSMTRGQKGEEG